MKITGSAGHNNTFTEINIGHVENFNPDVKEIISYSDSDSLTLRQLTSALQDAGSKFSTADIPIRFNGERIRHMNVCICQDDKGNYYIDIKD